VNENPSGLGDPKGLDGGEAEMQYPKCNKESREGAKFCARRILDKCSLQVYNGFRNSDME